MKLISSKELGRQPDLALRELDRTGGLVVTQNGQPKAVLLPTSEETLLEDLRAQTAARARRAVSEIRRSAARQGLNRLTLADVDQEIAAVRKARRRK